MNNKTILLVCVALALAGAYVRYFMDWHKQPDIQIFCEKSRRAMMRGDGKPAVCFHFAKTYPLTSIEVVDAEDARTNKFPHILWHLVAEGKPVPTTSFNYGVAIKGMKQQISTAEPDPLEEGAEYILLVEGEKSLKGRVSFQPY